MEVDRHTIGRLVIAAGLASVLFAMTTLGFHSTPLLLLVAVGTVLLAGFHAYDGGSPRTTILIPLLVAVGLMAGVRVTDLGGCPTVPGCFPPTPLQTYVEWSLFATMLGVSVYLVGFTLRGRSPSP